jgi:DNA repair exonuclease SbcCD nuclease subunit
MKIAHISDIHININATQLGKIKLNKKGQNEVYLNRLKILQFCIDQAVDNNVDEIILTGDIFDKVKPYPLEYYDLAKILKPVIKKTKLIYGNHDEMTNKGSGLQPLLAMGYNVSLDVTEDTPDCYYIPWNKLKLEDISKNPTLVALHAGVKDEKHKWVEIEGEPGNVELQQLINLGAKAILLGHHHTQCELAPNIWYAGSPECFTFGEEHDTKGMLIWTIDSDKTKVKQISTNHLFSKFHTLTPDQFLNKEHGIDALVRIKGEVTEQERVSIIKKLKDFECIDYKLDLVIKNKNKKVEQLAGKSDTDILRSYFEKKQIQDVDKLVELSKEF